MPKLSGGYCSNSVEGGNSCDVLSITWTDETRETTPSSNLIGYNSSKKRIEYFVKAEEKWYYMWADELDATIPACLPKMFAEDFENGWYMASNFAALFTEDFENGWYMTSNFAALFTEDFENSWCMTSNFAVLFTEDFEDESWG